MDEVTMKTLFILNDAPCGSERTCNGLRLAGAISKQESSICGADLSGKPSSTIGFEKRWSPRLSMGKQAFSNNLFEDVPPRSAGTDKVIAAKTTV